MPSRSKIVRAVLVAPLLFACSASDGNATRSGQTDSERFCSSFVAHYAQLSGRGVGVDVPSLRSGFADINGTLDELQQSAPMQIKPDVDRLATFLRDYAATLAKYGFDYSRVQAEATPAELAKLDGSDAAEIRSFNNIQHFVRDRCINAQLPSDASDFS